MRLPFLEFFDTTYGPLLGKRRKGFRIILECLHKGHQYIWQR
jgi:hypothetical protein